MSGGNATSWNDQVEDWVKIWTDAQKKMWESWSDLAANAPNLATPSASYAEWADFWRKWADHGVLTSPVFVPPADGVSTAADVAERMVNSQKAWVQFVQFLTEAWQSVATKAGAGEDWQTTANSYTEQLRQQLVQAPARSAELTQDLVELWRLYVEELTKVSQPWLRSSQLAKGHLGQAVMGDRSELISLANLYWDAYERTFGRLLESPSMGYTRELNEKILHGFDIWKDSRQAAFEYQVVLADTWVKAFERVLEELGKRAENNQPIKSLRELALLWNDIADPVFIEVFRSEKFIKIQGRMLNVAMAQRLHQRELTELNLKANDLPTRSEVDEAHRKIYQQGKLLKSLKKTLSATAAAPAREAPPAAPTPQVAPGDYASAPELEEARRNIEELRQEIQTLREMLAAQSQNGSNGGSNGSAPETPANDEPSQPVAESAEASDSADEEMAEANRIAAASVDTGANGGNGGEGGDMSAEAASGVKPAVKFWPFRW